MTEHADEEGAVATARRAGFEPLEPFDDADKPWRCRCLTCRRVVTPRLSSIGAGAGCKYCVTQGLDLNGPAIIFVLTHPVVKAHLLGFDAADGDQLDRCTQLGWVVAKTAKVPTVEDAYEIEAAALRWLRLDLGLPEGAPSGLPDGARETTVPADAVTQADLWARVSDELSRRRRRRRAAGGTRSGR